MIHTALLIFVLFVPFRGFINLRLTGLWFYRKGKGSDGIDRRTGQIHRTPPHKISSIGSICMPCRMVRIEIRLLSTR